MPIADLLHNARFLTNSLGEQTDVVISIDTWNTLISVIQQIQPLEDAHWAKLADEASGTSAMVGSDRFTQEIEQLIALGS
jgi:mRNA interferase RelE/StbE